MIFANVDEVGERALMRGFILHASVGDPVVRAVLEEVTEERSVAVHMSEVLEHRSIVLLVLEEMLQFILILNELTLAMHVEQLLHERLLFHT